MFPNDLKHFRAAEFAPHADKMDVAFLYWLNVVRERAGVPFVVISSYRLGDKGHHGRGMAVDLDSRRWSSRDKFKVCAAIMDSRELAPGKVEFEPVYNADPEKDHHWHVAVDPRGGAEHEFVEADE